MKALHEKVNIVPLIAKADCLVPGEIRKLKERVSLRGWGSARGSGGTEAASPSPDSPRWLQIREEIDRFGIHVYQFPECDSDEDEDFKQQDRELKVSLQHLGDPRGHATAGLEEQWGPGLTWGGGVA